MIPVNVTGYLIIISSLVKSCTHNALVHQMEAIHNLTFVRSRGQTDVSISPFLHTFHSAKPTARRSNVVFICTFDRLGIGLQFTTNYSNYNYCKKSKW